MDASYMMIKKTLKKMKLHIIYNYLRAILLNNLMERGVFSSTLRKILPILEEGGSEKAAVYLLKKHRFPIFRSIHFLKNLYQYANLTEKQNLKLWNIERTDRKVIIHFCCWGVRYADKIKNYLLPSLLSENNLPTLAKSHSIVLLIHCDRLTENIITKSDAYDKLIKYATIKFCVFPPTLMKLYDACAKPRTHIAIFPSIRYLLLGVCQTHAFKVALVNRAYISLLMPDFVLSESFMNTAFEKIMNKNVVLTTTYRTDYRGASTDLKKYYVNSDGGQQLIVSSNKLVELQIKHIHPNEKKRIVSTATENFTPKARLIFKNKKGYTFRCFHYHPIIINCKDICRPIKLDYLPIDNTALNCVLANGIPYQDQAWVCDNASQMAIMELSDENPETEIIINKNTLSYQELVTQVGNLITREPKIYDSPFNRFLVSHRHQLIAENAEAQNAGDIIDDTIFFSEIYKFLNESRGYIR